ncbi:hypothetical protein OH807_00520 [Kitasatospora sp. NBC_01560]|uniref:hypothetical protein n=1 Tax=Kitasatospora sp. NBC_01560 TaxID=2975965 RepID=UPI00386C6BC1
MSETEEHDEALPEQAAERAKEETRASQADAAKASDVRATTGRNGRRRSSAAPAGGQQRAAAHGRARRAGPGRPARQRAGTSRRPAGGQGSRGQGRGPERRQQQQTQDCGRAGSLADIEEHSPDGAAAGRPDEQALDTTPGTDPTNGPHRSAGRTSTRQPDNEARLG